MKSHSFLSVLLLTFVANLILGFPGSGISAEDTLRIVIPFNNCSEDIILKTGPGFSVWIQYGDRLAVIAGCSHPGIETLVELVSSRFPGKEIALLLGGFHLEDKSAEEIKGISDYLKGAGVKAIAPSHCTGETAIEYFRNDWGEGFLQLILGDEFTEVL